jgi:phosphoribosyl-ATP pyrophosphohydrolase
MIKEKIAEEAQELIDANTREEIIWEAADVLFFSLARCAKNGVTYNEVVNELRRRRRV